MKKVENWMRGNIAAIMIVIGFIPMFAFTQTNREAVKYFGTTSLEYLNHEFYRWITCIFYHNGFVHLFFNSLALICAGSLLSPFIGKWKTFFLFLLGGSVAEIPFSLIYHYGEVSYGGGSSGGIFALIAAFLACWLRFPEAFHLKKFRPDLLMVFVFFVFANDSVSSFLTHVFGFVVGTVATTVMIASNVIKDSKRKIGKVTMNT